MVDYVEYNGKKHPVKMAMLALKGFEQETGKTIQDIGDDLHLHAVLLWHSIKVGYEFINKPFFKKDGDKEVPILTQRDCYWLLDEAFLKYYDI